MTRIITMAGVALILLLAMAQMAHSADVQKQIVATWTYDAATAAAEGILGFRLKNANNAVVVGNIPVTSRTATGTITTDGKACQSFYLTAYSKDDETTPSNILTWCPARKPLTGVGTFTIEIKE